jgi:hypothetical protein
MAQHKERTGKADQTWPDWYAVHIVRELAGKDLPT